MEEIGCCDKGLDVVIFSTCLTVASSIDEECVVFVIGEDEEEVSEETPLRSLLLRLRITSPSVSSPFSSLSSVSFIEADNGEFDGEEEEEDNPLLERSRGCWAVLEVKILFFLSPSIPMCLLLLRSVINEGRGSK